MKAFNVQKFYAEQRQKRLDKKEDFFVNLSIWLIIFALSVIFILIVRHQINAGLI